MVGVCYGTPPARRNASDDKTHWNSIYIQMYSEFHQLVQEKLFNLNAKHRRKERDYRSAGYDNNITDGLPVPQNLADRRKRGGQ